MRNETRRNGLSETFIGADAYENTHPYRLGRIAAKFPETRFLLIHIGGAGTPSLDRAAIEVTSEHSNITLIGSNVPEQAIDRAIRVFGADWVCFGGDAPFRIQHVQLLWFALCCPTYLKTVKQRFLARTSVAR